MIYLGPKMTYIWKGQYQVFTDYFSIGFINWDKTGSSMKLLLWWDLAIGWLRVRKHKTATEITQAVDRYKEKNK